MRILVVIVSYNFEPWIDRCLGSLRQSEEKADILVIDNASQDNTVQIIESRYPEVSLIRSKVNLGFGRANNIGISIALEKQYDFVFLMNQDAWIDKHALSKMKRTLLEYPEFGILSPVHLTGAGDKLDKGFAGYAKLTTPEEIRRKIYDRRDSAIDPAPELLYFVNAAFWMIPIDVLKHVGGFCPLFYHYGEDVDLINRMHYHNYSVGYLPTAFGCHDRQYREVSHKKWLRSEEIYLLTEYANIRYSFGKAFGYGVLAGLKKSWKALRRTKVGDCAAYLGISLRLLTRTREVWRYRKANRSTGNEPLYLTKNHTEL